VRESLSGLRRDRTLVVVVLGVALGAALWDIARGISDLLTLLLKHYPDRTYYSAYPLTGPSAAELSRSRALLAG
jgi:hypothetical protein